MNVCKETESWEWWRSQKVRGQVSSIVARVSFNGQGILIDDIEFE